jgi:hypothetical protein
MHAPAPTSLKPATKWTEGLFGNEKGEISLEKAAAVKSVYLDQEFASPGVVFEPLKERKHGFLYGSYQWCEGNESEIVVMFSTHRVILRGKRLDHLPEQFSSQKVRRVCAVGRADNMLADTADVKNAVVSEIKIDRLNDQGQVDE